MQIAEAFVAIRPSPDSKANFQREVTGIVTPAATKAGQDAGKAISTGVVGSAKKTGSKAGDELGAGLTSSVKASVAGLAQIVGTIGAGVFLKGAFTVEEAAITSNAKLLAILKATGGQAGVTAEGVDQLSASLSKSTATADETIKNAAALLLTFRDVRNEAGKGNDVFDRTVKVSTDLSAAFGRDLQSSITQLGRALENPAAGLTALTRSGITFSAQVRDQIKTLTQQGNLLGAQTLILDEVEKKFGGTAAAIAKADPFKRFGANLIVFKEQIGQDLLPIADDILHVFTQLFNLFESLPGPIRGTTEALVAVGIAGAGVARVATVLGGITGLSGGLAALKASLFGVATGEEAAAAAGLSLGSIIGGLAVGLGAGVLGGQKLNEVLGGHQPGIDAYAKSLSTLGKTGTLGGTALDALGDHAKKLSGDLETIRGNTIEKAFGFAPSAHRAVADIKSVNDALISLLNTQGKDAALRAEGQLVSDLLANGTKIGDIGPQLHPFHVALDDIAGKSTAAASGVQSLVDKIDNLIGASSSTAGLAQKLGVEDAFTSATDALDALNKARLDALGLGEKSKAAADAETTAVDNQKQAYQSLADAQQAARDSSRSLADAQTSLADAQAKLAEFDNPTSRTIRSLEREQIVRRVVATPADVRQKEIDLLKHDQGNTDTRASLVKGVVTGQENVAKAVEGVQKAEENVQKATEKVADAQRAVVIAAQKRKQVMQDALDSIQGLERKAEEAALSAGAAFAQWAKDTQPADDVLKSMLDKLVLITTAAGDPGLAKSLKDLVTGITTAAATAGQLSGQNPGARGGIGHGRPASDNSNNTPDANNALKVYSHLNPQLRAQVESGNAPLTQSDVIDIIQNHVAKSDPRLNKTQVDFLHRLGVPGFASGGLANWPLGEARLAVLHGQETVTPAGKARRAPTKVEQHNHYHGSDKPTPADVEWNNRQLAFLITRQGDEA